MWTHCYAASCEGFDFDENCPCLEEIQCLTYVVKVPRDKNIKLSELLFICNLGRCRQMSHFPVLMTILPLLDRAFEILNINFCMSAT